MVSKNVYLQLSSQAKKLKKVDKIFLKKQKKILNQQHKSLPISTQLVVHIP